MTIQKSATYTPSYYYQKRYRNNFGVFALSGSPGKDDGDDPNGYYCFTAKIT